MVIFARKLCVHDFLGSRNIITDLGVPMAPHHVRNRCKIHKWTPCRGQSVGCRENTNRQHSLLWVLALRVYHSLLDFVIRFLSLKRCQALQYRCTIDMVFHMKTTLNIDDTVMAQLKREAARQKRTMSELVETALRGLFRSQRKRQDVPPLPTFHSGGTLVDVADRDALYQAMEGR
jgi:hypothetical protein